MIPPPPRSTLFPYTTLFRSSQLVGQREPLSTAYGSPLVQRTIPLKPQLPTMAFTIPPLLPSQRLPWPVGRRSEEHTSELQSRRDLVCRLLLEKKNYTKQTEKPKHFYLRHLCDFVRLFIIKLKLDILIGFEKIPKDIV